MYSLSTSWISSKYKNSGIELINEIKAIGFDTVELNFSLTEKTVNDILSLKKKAAIKVSSLHNMCPLPKEIPPEKASPDYYSLASPDDQVRQLAVQVAKNTIRYAKMFDARAVVLHAGFVEDMEDRTRYLASLITDEERFSEVRLAMVKERSMKRARYLDNAIKSLSELIPYAGEMNVSLGIENRYYYRDIPIPEELEIIFNNFKAGELYYWHDTGHAEVFNRLGLVHHKDLLDKFSKRLIGLHLHDIIGPMNDHKAPGAGTFDFKIVKPYITKDTIRVLEIHQPAGADQIRDGVKYLTDILG